MRPDSQDVGLEAAIIERVRNSSLVECACTDNVARLKHPTDAVESARRGRRAGRGAFGVPGSQTETTGGARRSANAGMSSACGVRTTTTESLRVPGHRQSSQG